MKIKNLVLISLTLWMTLQGGFAQKTLLADNEDTEYRLGYELFTKGKYGAAQKHFDRAVEAYGESKTVLKSNAMYYAAVCAVELLNSDAEHRMARFLADYPENQNHNMGQFYLAKHFYRNRNYRKSIEWYEAVNRSELEWNDQEELFFQLGYSYFMRNDPDKAGTMFYAIKDRGGRYASPATYYYAHISYTNNHLETALQGFLKLTDDETFAPLAPYYIVQIYYLQRKYEQVIALGPDLLKSATSRRVPEINRLIGESHYRMRNYREAIPYFEEYMSKSRDISRDDRYQLGYSYYRTEQYAKAAPMFERVVGPEDLLTQNASYHLADCYLKTGDKQKARVAFANAARLEFDESIREDALFNYSVMTYELSYTPFNEAISGFNSFIERYPNSRRIDEAYTYLVNAYLNTRNYRDAILSLNKIRNKTPEIRKAYQRVAFYRGLELFSNLRFEDVVDMMNISLQYAQYSPSIAAQSHYWKAEAYYRLNDFDEAIRTYNRFLVTQGAFGLDEYNMAHYNLGYSYFKKKDYANALSWFRKYINLTREAPTRLVGDALNRIGDCFFITTDYASAVEYYDRAIRNGQSDLDYAYFQKGFSLGLQNQLNEKILVLTKLTREFPGSSYLPDALYELGRSYLATDSPDQALIHYKKIVDEHSTSNAMRGALLQLGLIHYNRNQNELALEYYKKILTQYPGTSEARSALAGVRNIYVDMNDIDAYLAYTKTLGDFANVTVSEQDSLTYTAAENVYMSGDCQSAKEHFRRYIERFATGSFILNAHFYKADCHYRMNEFAEAIESFNVVISRPKNMFTEQALLTAGEINYRMGNYMAALDNYTDLEKNADLRTNQMEAKTGQMRSNYQLHNHAATIESVKKVLASDKIPAEIIREATFYDGKAQMALGQLDNALESFRKVAVEVSSQEGAESKFRIAEIYLRKDLDKRAEEEVYSFVSMNTPHQYWMASAFILLADVYMKTGDDFQAQHTLQSVLDHYDLLEDGIIETARRKLDDILKKQEAAGEKKAEEQLEINL
jgi:TolA-binding protein